MREGRAHAALVFDGADCLAWSRFGSSQELPRIHNQRAYLATDSKLPDWRITCFFSGKGHREVASAALKGANEQIRQLGGGRIEGRHAAPAFLFNGALSAFERLGFRRSRRIGKHKWG